MQKDVTIIFSLFNKSSEIISSVEKVIIKLSISKLVYEIILCDDGSTDDTLMICQKLQQKYPLIKIMKNTTNRGRGYCVKKSVKESVGKKIIYMDSDIAYTTNIDFIFEVIDKLDEEEVIIANRFDKSSKTNRKPIRKFIGYFYRLIVSLIFPQIYISDCEAGFKGFQSHVIKKYAAMCLEDRWSFDLELIWILSIKRVKITQIPMDWNERYENYNSTVNLVTDSISQFLGFFRIRNRHKKR